MPSTRIAEVFCLFLVLMVVIIPSTADDPPKIERAPHNQTVISGGVASFTCTVLGNPKPVIEWRKNGRRLVTARYAVQDMPNGSVLRIEPVRKDLDVATYECVAENGVGLPVFAKAKLNVLSKDQIPLGFPKFTVEPSLQGVERGRDALLPCQATGTPQPDIFWLKDFVPVKLDDPRLQLIHGGSLQIKYAEDEDNGDYECVAENAIGTAISKRASLYVRALPPPPSDVRISDVTATSVRLSWSYNTGAENVRYYVVQYKPKKTNQDYSEISGINSKFYTIQDLSPYTEYEFFVIAANDIGRSSPSTPAIATTGETEPGSAPRNVTARPLSSSTIVIQWDPPKKPNGQVTSYKVYYTTNPKLPTNAWNTQTVDRNQLTTISDMTPHTI